jgi:hypothetical protein
VDNGGGAGAGVFGGVLMILGLTFDAGRAAFIGALAGVGRRC